MLVVIPFPHLIPEIPEALVVLRLRYGMMLEERDLSPNGLFISCHYLQFLHGLVLFVEGFHELGFFALFDGEVVD